MGYTTVFEGAFRTDKTIDNDTAVLLKGINETRRMIRKIGPEYGIDGEFYIKEDNDESVIDGNTPPITQPGLRMQWLLEDDDRTIMWDGNEKFYNYIEWLTYIIHRILDPRGYLLSGEVWWSGEETTDNGKIIVEDNYVWINTLDDGKELVDCKPKISIPKDLSSLNGSVISMGLIDDVYSFADKRSVRYFLVEKAIDNFMLIRDLYNNIITHVDIGFFQYEVQTIMTQKEYVKLKLTDNVHEEIS